MTEHNPPFWTHLSLILDICVQDRLPLFSPFTIHHSPFTIHVLYLPLRVFGDRFERAWTLGHLDTWTLGHLDTLILDIVM